MSASSWKPSAPIATRGATPRSGHSNAAHSPASSITARTRVPSRAGASRAPANVAAAAFCSARDGAPSHARANVHPCQHAKNAHARAKEACAQ